MLTPVFVLSVAVGTAAAQQTVQDVLSFLMTNRTVSTDDFDRDEQAAVATRDTIASFLALELATVPISSSSGGFAYRLDPALGLDVRASESFGPFFTERTLTSGAGRVSVGLALSSATYGTLDGRDLRDGTLVSTAATLAGEAEPFDVETVSLRIRTDTMTLSAAAGITDRIDVSAAVPVSRVSLDGERVDTYRGTAVTQAVAVARAYGLGDVVVRARLNLLRSGAGGLAVGGEARLPTGDEENLLGSGRASYAPRFMASYEHGRVGLHGNVAYAFRGVADTLNYAAAVTVVPSPRVTVVGELLGRRIDGVGRLASTALPHPRIPGVTTVRLTAVPDQTSSLVAVGGIKWNVAGSWLLEASVLRPLTDVGLNASWVPTITFDFAFDG